MLTGNLGSDPVVSEKTVSFILASENSFIKDGRRRTSTSWIPVKVFKPGLISSCSMLQKGSKVAIEGFISSYKSDDSEYLTVVADEIEFLAKIKARELEVETF